MHYSFYIALGTGLVVLGIILTLIIRRRRKREVEHPLIARSKDLMVMINQRIHSLNSRIQKLDSETTKFLAANEKADLSLIKNDLTLEEIPKKIETSNIEINALIADVKDLQEYRNEINAITSKKSEQNWEDLEKLLNLAKEKLQFRYV